MLIHDLIAVANLVHFRIIRTFIIIYYVIVHEVQIQSNTRHRKNEKGIKKNSKKFKIKIKIKNKIKHQNAS